MSRIISHFVHSSILLAMIGISSHHTRSLPCCVLYHSPVEPEPVSCTIILWHQLYPATFRFLWLAWLVQGPQVCVQTSFVHTLCSAGPSSLSCTAVDSQQTVSGHCSPRHSHVFRGDALCCLAQPGLVLALQQSLFSVPAMGWSLLKELAMLLFSFLLP